MRAFAKQCGNDKKTHNAIFLGQRMTLNILALLVLVPSNLLRGAWKLFGSNEPDINVRSPVVLQARCCGGVLWTPATGGCLWEAAVPPTGATPASVRCWIQRTPPSSSGTPEG